MSPFFLASTSRYFPVIYCLWIKFCCPLWIRDRLFSWGYFCFRYIVILENSFYTATFVSIRKFAWKCSIFEIPNTFKTTVQSYFALPGKFPIQKLAGIGEASRFITLFIYTFCKICVKDAQGINSRQKWQNYKNQKWYIFAAA